MGDIEAEETDLVVVGCGELAKQAATVAIPVAERFGLRIERISIEKSVEKSCPCSIVK